MIGPIGAAVHVEFENLAVQYAATYGLRCACLIFGGNPLPRHSAHCPEDVIDMFEATGLAVVRDGRRMLVGAGTCDVDRPWRRAWLQTRADHARWHAEAAERIATRLARDVARRLRKTQARAAAARADGDEGGIRLEL